MSIYGSGEVGSRFFCVEYTTTTTLDTVCELVEWQEAAAEEVKAAAYCVICNHLQLSKSRSWDSSRDPDLLL